MSAIPPSGNQYEISAGPHRATVVEVGGAIRTYSVDGRQVLDPFPVDAMADGAHGTPLIPWPNRLAGGRYSFAGKDYQVALTEPEKGNAIHGFLRWRPWQPVEQAADRIVMGTRLYPLSGYPFTLDVQVEYALADDGLTVRTTATNLGDEACPYACGQHPYLSPGDGLIDDCVLTLEADTRIDTDDERQLPTGAVPVEGTPYDFRAGKRLGDLAIDHAFTDLSRDADGRAWERLAGTDGRNAELWVDDSYSLIQVFTGDTLAPGRRRRGLGAEPMTCPPNGLQTGEGVIVLEPGEGVTTTWGARLA